MRLDGVVIVVGERGFEGGAVGFVVKLPLFSLFWLVGVGGASRLAPCCTLYDERTESWDLASKKRGG